MIIKKSLYIILLLYISLLLFNFVNAIPVGENDQSGDENKCINDSHEEKCPYGEISCTRARTCEVEENFKTDILFIIDESDSMDKYFNALRSGLKDLFKELQEVLHADPRYAVVSFGGRPRILTDFTDNVDSVSSSFDKLDSADKSHGHEAGLETIRMALDSDHNLFQNCTNLTNDQKTTNCENGYDSQLNWRTDGDVEKVIILLTNENSDFPFFKEYRNVKQQTAYDNFLEVKEELLTTYDTVFTDEQINQLFAFPADSRTSGSYLVDIEKFYEPTFYGAQLVKKNKDADMNFQRSVEELVLGKMYQEEVDETAKIITKNDVQIYLIITGDEEIVSNDYYASPVHTYGDSKTSLVELQYGNVHIDDGKVPYGEFDAESVYSKLKNINQENSLQGQILKSYIEGDGGFIRTFVIEDFVQNSNYGKPKTNVFMVNNLYSRVAEKLGECMERDVPICREPVKLIVDPNGGIYNDTPENTTYEGAPLDTQDIDVPTRENFKFDKWEVVEDGGGSLNDGGSEFTYGDKDATIKATWIPQYKINYYVRDSPNDEYVLSEGETVIDYGNAGTPIDILEYSKLKENYDDYQYKGGYPGTESTNIPGEDSMETTEILEDGTRVVNLFYDKIQEITLTVDPNGGEYNDSKDKTVYVSEPYGEDELIAVPSRDGYEFKGWKKISDDDGNLNEDPTSYSYGGSDAEIQAIWEPADNKFTVYHFVKEANSDEYQYKSMNTYWGKTDDIITVDDYKKYLDYEYQGGWEGTKPSYEPISDTPVETSNVLPGGKRVLNLYYIKNEPIKITLTVDPNGGEYNGSEDNTVYEAAPYSGKEPISIPTREGYVFTGWEKVSEDDGVLNEDGSDYNYGGEDGYIKATWEKANTTYIVNHYVKSVGNDSFEFKEKQKENGIVGNEVEIPPYAKNYEGYVFIGGYAGTEASNKPEDREPDESTDVLSNNKRVINLYYVESDKPLIKLIVDPNGGEYNGSEDNTVYEAVPNSGKEPLSVPTREGYVFTGWEKVSEDDGVLNEDGSDYKYGSEDAYIKATWEKANTTYIINHYVKSVGDDSFEFKEKQKENGIVGNEVEIPPYAKNYEGYVFIGGYAGTEASNKPEDREPDESTDVLSNNKRVINLYYVESDKPLIKLIVDPNGGEYNGSEDNTVYEAVPNSGKEPLSVPTREGYVFTGWEKVSEDDGVLNEDGSDYKYGSEDAYIKATWEKANTTYIINHYVKSVGDDSFEFKENQKENGIVGNEVEIPPLAKNYEGYEFIGGYAGTEASNKPEDREPDESTDVLSNNKRVINLYYVESDKPLIKLIVDPNGGEYNGSEDNTVYEAAPYSGKEPLSVPTREGYVFTGWEKVSEDDGVLNEDGSDYKYGSEDAYIKATWEKANTTYIINHYVKSVGDDSFEFKEKQKENGIVGNEVEIPPYAKNYEGYVFIGGYAGTEASNKPEDREPDESTDVLSNNKRVINLYYVESDKPLIKLIVDPNGGEYNGSEDNTVYEAVPNSGKEPLSVPTREGYVFTGWEKVSEDDGVLNEDGSDYKYGSEDAYIKATWEKANTTYIINHYVKSVGDDSFEFKEKQKENGIVGNEVEIPPYAKNYEGYEFIGGYAGTEASNKPEDREPDESTDVLSNNKRVINLYYVESDKPLIKLIVDPNGGEYNGSEDNTVYEAVPNSGKEPLSVPTREGYVFTGWEKVSEDDGVLNEDGSDYKYGNEDAYIKATWEKANTTYIINHYVKSVGDDSFEFKEKQKENGIVGNEVEIPPYAKNYEGYVFIGGYAGTEASNKPEDREPDESTDVLSNNKRVINLYYVESDKPLIKLIVDPNGGEYNGSEDNTVYEAVPNSGKEPLSVPTREGYVFTGWEKVSEDDGVLNEDGSDYKYGSEDAYIKATWEKANTTYIINHYVKSVGDDSFEFKEKQKENGIVGNEVEIPPYAKNYEGYVFIGGYAGTEASNKPEDREPDESTDVLSNNKRVINLYYVESDKPLIKLIVDPNGGEYNGSEDNTVYEAVPNSGKEPLSVPIREGYVFTGWEKVSEDDGVLNEDGSDYKYGSEDAYIKATWEKANTTYIINHYVKSVGDDSFEFKEKQKEDGIVGNEVEIPPYAKNYEGYEFIGGYAGTEASNKPEDREPDESTDVLSNNKRVINLYYVESDKPLIKLIVDPNGGEYNGSEDNTVYEAVPNSGKEPLSVPTREGYVFTGWEKVSEDDGVLNEDGSDYKYGSEDAYIKATWEKANTTYIINHYVKSVGDDSFEFKEKQKENGIVGNEVEIPPYAKNYEGYVFIGGYAGTEASNKPEDREPDESTDVLSNNKRVINLYYVESDKPLIKLIVDPNGGEYNGSEDNTVYEAVPNSGKEPLSVPTREGYVFTGWEKVSEDDGVLNEDGSDYKYGSEDAYIKATWEKANTTYIINHYVKSVGDDSFEFKEKQKEDGIVGNEVEIPPYAKNYEGYEFIGGYAGTEASNKPEDREPDESTDVLSNNKRVINLYYVESDKPLIKLIVDPNGGEYNGSEDNTVYEAVPNSGKEPLSVPTREGYVFTGWEKVSEDDGVLNEDGSDYKYGSEDAYIKATWEKANTTYIINHYVKSVGDDSFEFKEKQKENGIVGNEVEIPPYAKNYEGYVFIGGYAGTEASNKPEGREPDESTDVLSNNKRVINLYYVESDKPLIKLIVDPNGGEYNGSEDNTVYEAVPNSGKEPLSVPIREGYVFTGWEKVSEDDGVLNEDGSDYKYGSEDAYIKATWEKANTTYIINHYVKSVGDDSFEFKEKQKEDGIVGNEVEIPPYAKNYEGYVFIGGYAGTEASNKPEDREPDESTDVLSNNKRVINLYYVESDKPLIKLIVDPNGGEYNGSEDNTVYEAVPNSGKEPLSVPTREGYVFTGWEKVSEDDGVLNEDGSDYKYGNEDAYIKATWEKANTTYIINHYVKSVGDDSFEFKEKQKENGIVGNEVEIPPYAKNYEGYVFIGGYAGTEASNKPEDREPDESTDVLSNNKRVINLYYVESDKPLIKLIVDPNGGEYNGSEDNTVYEAVPNSGKEPLSVPTREGYVFTGWEKVSEDDGVLNEDGSDYKYGNEDAYIKATWEKANTTYIINHYVKSVGDDSFEFKEKQKEDGIVGNEVEIPPYAKNYEGYVFIGGYAGTEASNKPEDREPDESTDVLSNNKRVINLYYVESDKPLIKLIVDPNGGEYNGSEDNTVYEAVPNSGKEPLSVPTREGYVFTGWEKVSEDDGVLNEDGSDYKYGNEDAYIKATWEKANTTYIINHYVKSVGDDSFEFKEKQKENGIVGNEVEIPPYAKNYEGYEFIGGYAGTEASNKPEDREPDESTDVLSNNKRVINLYYVESDKPLIKLIVDPNGGEYNGSEDNTVYEAVPNSGKEPLSVPTREGYVFTGWEKVSEDDGVLNEDGSDYKYGNEDAYIKATWEKANTTYIINHYVKSVGDDSFEFKEKQKENGIVGNEVEIPPYAKNYEGYVFIGGYAGTEASNKPEDREPDESTDVLSNNKRVINLYYVESDKPLIKLIVDPNGGEYNGSEDNTVYEAVPNSGKEPLSVPTREGYVFTGWEKVSEDDGVLNEDGSDYKYGSEDAYIKATWEKANTTYIINHYVKSVGKDSFEFKEKQKEDGIVGNEVEIPPLAKNYEGYEFIGGYAGTEASNKPEDREPDESTDVLSNNKRVINLYYVESDKPLIKLIVDPNGGEYNGSEDNTVYEAVPNSGKEPLSVPTREGYVFTGWEKVSEDDGKLNEDGHEYKYGGSDAEIRAVWEPAEGTKYVVNYYTKCLDCKEYEFKNDETFKGKTNDVISIDKLVKTIGDYEFVGASDGTERSNVPGEFIKETTVLPDGTRQINMYYVEVEKPVINLIVKPNGGSYNNNEEDTVYSNVQYGPDQPIPDPVREGYEFKGWKVIEGDGKIDENSNFVYGKENAVIEAIWSPAEGTKYIVNYYTKCLDCKEYEFKNDETFKGKTNDVISIDKLVKTIGDYEFVGASDGTERSNVPGEFIKETTVLPDGTRQINMYYVEIEKPKITLTIKPNGGSYNNNEEDTVYSNVQYGPDQQIPDPVREGYEFKGWKKVEGDGDLDGKTFHYGSLDTVLEAIWTPANTKYTVRYYVKDANEEEYKLKETNVYEGVSGEVIPVSVLVKIYNDYIYEGASLGESNVPGEFIKEITLLPDNKLEISLYYVADEESQDEETEISKAIVEDEESQDEDISEDGRCGPGIGVCKSGECCSRYGWCGTTEKYCSVERGCQSEFGDCEGIKRKASKSVTSENLTSENLTIENLTISEDGRCGSGIGVCNKGECCSKYGWCGTSEKYCSIERGCQSEFGDCTGKEKNVNVATEKVNKFENTIAYSDSDRCGKNEGRCRNDECCSKYGWCGTTKSYCSKDKGCQSEFGRCW